MPDYLLLESGDRLLLESGGGLLLPATRGGGRVRADAVELSPGVP